MRVEEIQQQEPVNSVFNAILKLMLAVDPLRKGVFQHTLSPKKVQKVEAEHGTTRECRLPSGIALLLRATGSG